MVVMNEVREIFENECSWQFKTSRWNCSGVEPPIYSSELRGTVGKSYYAPHTRALAHHKPFIIIAGIYHLDFVPLSGLV